MAQWWEYSLSYHRCSLVSIPEPAVATCGLSLFLVHVLATRAFLPPQKTKTPQSNSIRKQWTRRTISLNINHQFLFFLIIMIFIMITTMIIIRIIIYIYIYLHSCASAGRKPCTEGISHSSQSFCSYTKHPFWGLAQIPACRSFESL